MKRIFGLIAKLVKNEGFADAIFLLVKMAWYKILDLFFFRKSTKTIQGATLGKRVIVFSKTIEWNNMFQRSQQLALEFAKRTDTVVIYVENCTTFDFFYNINPINKSLFCFSYNHYDRLNSLLRGSKEIVLYMTNLLDFDNSLTLKYDKMVYEYIDELELFFDDMKQAEFRHSNALRLADVSVSTATKLYDQIKDCSDNAILCPNAVDFQFFNNARNTTMAPELAQRVGKYDVVIGYYGCLASWFDYQTVIEVARRQPNWLFVLIGIIYDNSADQYDLTQCENILFTGAKPYGQLPSYIRGIDVLTIPFLVNNITKSTSPVKLFEYMASQTPILTSMLPECGKYKSVYRYDCVDDFIAKVNTLCGLMDSPEYSQLLLKEAMENTWSTRVNQILYALYGK